jgi:phospholipid/cholesterol/gamma-HCH transport system permease protein
VREVSYRLESGPGEGGGSAVRLAGRLVFREAGALRDDLLAAAEGAKPLTLDLSAVDSLDGGAAAILADVWFELGAHGGQLRFQGGAPRVQSVLELYTERAPRACLLPRPRRYGLLEAIGEGVLSVFALARSALAFIGSCTQAALAALRRPASVDWASVPHLAERAGADGLPIALLISFLVGLITSFQAAVQLQKFGANVFISDLVGLSITRELGPLMTAIVVAGRSGAGLAAELGTMKVSEEIDALNALRLCPYRTLVFPRVISLTLMLPLLVILADLVGVGAGLLIATAQLDLSMHGYVRGIQDAVGLWDVFGGLIKAVVFGFLIAMIACERGLSTRGGAEGVGRSTTSAVVTILFSLIAADAGFSILFNQLGI